MLLGGIDVRALGLDALFPAFFLALLVGELRASRTAAAVGLAGGVVALALVPVVPVGVPVLAAALVALVGTAAMTAWVVIALVALVTFAIKGSGPALLGDRELPEAFTRVVVLLAPALLAALVVTNALADGPRWSFGADTVGVAVAGVLVLRGVTVLPAVLVAAGVTALVRLLG